MVAVKSEASEQRIISVGSRKPSELELLKSPSTIWATVLPVYEGEETVFLNLLSAHSFRYQGRGGVNLEADVVNVPLLGVKDKKDLRRKLESYLQAIVLQNNARIDYFRGFSETIQLNRGLGRYS
jgi:hypothetical protein